mgnify:CR=1 FL=1|tara:strand:+ start:3429 stop:3749 length:321 start_codon:yes stop_codon:yes gene_type:complete
MTKVKEMPQPAASEDVKELSKEEIAKRKQEVSNFYKENIKHLKIQKEYESLLTEIEELRAKRLQAQMFQAQTYQGMEENEEPSQASVDFDKVKDQAELKKTLKRNQ